MLKRQVAKAGQTGNTARRERYHPVKMGVIYRIVFILTARRYSLTRTCQFPRAPYRKSFIGKMKGELFDKKIFTTLEEIDVLIS